MDKREIKREYKRRAPDMGLYQVRNLENGKVYIGRAKDLNGRLNSERFQLRNGMHANRELQRDFDLLGEGKFAFEVLDRLAAKDDPDRDAEAELKTLEEMWLEKLQPFAPKGYHRMRG